MLLSPSQSECRLQSRVSLVHQFQDIYIDPLLIEMEYENDDPIEE